MVPAGNYRIDGWLVGNVPWEVRILGEPVYITITDDNYAPNIPSEPTGQSEGEINVEYIYTTATTDPEDEQIYYWFEWGDGTNSGWTDPYNSGEEVNAKHKWTREKLYLVKVKAKDIHGAESCWSDPLRVYMPRKRAINNQILSLLENNPLILKLLQQFLRI